MAHLTPRRIEGVPGPEDVVIDHELGIAYVSSQLREPSSARHVNGDIFRIDLNAEDPQPVSMIRSLEEGIGFFHPHGLDLFVGNDGKRRLFVINHRSEDTHSIEIFDVEESGHALHYFRRVSHDESLTSPNDLVALGEDSFLVVNDHGCRGKLAKGVEDVARFLFGVGFGTVVRGKLTAEGTHWELVARDIGMGAGIEVDDRQRPACLYVSSASGNKILTFKREGEDWSPSGAIALDAGPDNLNWDRMGRLWVAAHPDPLAFVFYVAGWRESAPSRVLRISAPQGPEPAVDCIYSDDGSNLSAASVAALYIGPKRSRLLVGAVAGRHLLLFDLPPET
jgi:arylesterase/paraoxonase